MKHYIDTLASISNKHPLLAGFLAVLLLAGFYLYILKGDSAKRVRLFSFVRRNGLLLVLTFGTGWLALSDSVFQAVGPVIYLPILTLGSGVVATLFRSIFNSRTTDPYTDDKIDTRTQYANDFHNLPTRDKVWFTAIQFWVYFLGACLVASSIIKL